MEKEKMNQSKIISWIILLTVLLLCIPANAAEESLQSANEGKTRLTMTADNAAEENAAARILVFETSDIHGYMIDTSSGNEDTFQYRMAYIAQVVNDARAAAARKQAGNIPASTLADIDDVLLLDGGDIYQGSPVSNLLEGSAIRAALDNMGYDAVALGNHEFDWGVTDYNADENGTVPAYDIGYVAGDPDIPILASNLYYENTGRRVNFTKDYTIVEKAGYRIALVGYIPDYSAEIMAEQIAPYDIDDSLQHLDVLVRIINALEKPDVTIVMAHDDPVPIAEAMDPEQVDLVTGGHTHKSVYGFAENGIPYIQGGCQAQGYAYAYINIDSAGNVIVDDAGYVSITDDKSLLYDTKENAGRLDDTVLSVSHAAWAEVGDEMSEVLGYIDTPVDLTETSDNGATYEGNWITGLMLRAMEPYGAVAAFYNSGGIRTNIYIPWNQSIRQLTAGDIYTMIPFCNSYLVFEITGEELAKQLIKGLKSEGYGDQMSGLTFEYSQTGDEDKPEYTILNITLDDGTEVDIHDDQARYRVCTSNYSSTKRGSVFYDKDPVFPESEAPIDNITLIETLREIAAENGGYIPVDTGPRGILAE